MYNFLTKPRFYFFLWAILSIHVFLSALPISGVTFFFCLSTMLIFTHVLYGGYYLFKSENKIDLPVACIISLIYLSLVFFACSILKPTQWFIAMITVFICAISLHGYYKTRVSQIYLQEFCNYKIFVEVCGTLYSLLGLIFYLAFPQYLYFLGIISLFSVMRLNNAIFQRKKLYTIFYDLPKIPPQPLVSIVVVAYNEEHYIGKLLESICNQDYPKFEVIVVDDHSEDKTVEVVKGFSHRLPLRVVQKPIRGISRSRNYGATFANGEIILFLDSDVILGKHFISRNLNTFFDKKLSLAGVDFVPITRSKVDKLIVESYRIWLKIVEYFNPRGVGISLFVYTQVHKKTLFDETVVMSEDFDYIKRATLHGKFRIIETVPVHVSWRRFKNENRFILILKYCCFEWYRQHIGEIRSTIIPYEFGKSS